MLQRTDVVMYLVAIKSLYAQIREGAIVVIDDGTLREADRQTLCDHIKPIEIATLGTVPLGKCPTYTSWHRLFKALSYARDNYVIQVDADTLTLTAIPEVVSCYKDNCAFILGTGAGQRIVTTKDAAEFSKNVKSDHVQILAERSLVENDDPARRHYVRGSAGFTGYPRRAIELKDVEQFSSSIEATLGSKWRQWGSEQVTTNYFVANTPNSRVLPFPKYCCFDGEREVQNSAFVHFVGGMKHRFRSGVYAHESQRVIRELLV